MGGVLTKPNKPNTIVCVQFFSICHARISKETKKHLGVLHIDIPPERNFYPLVSCACYRTSASSNPFSSNSMDQRSSSVAQQSVTSGWWYTYPSEK